MKTTLGKSKKQALLDGVLEESDNDLGIENHVITSPKKRALKAEKRTAKIGVYVQPSEKKEFLKNIGRESESDIVRELILYALGKPADPDKEDTRNAILDLIKKNHG